MNSAGMIVFRMSLIAVFIVIDSSQVKAEDYREKETTQSSLHLLAGCGINMTSYTSDEDDRNLGIGSNFKADIVWLFTKRWAVESSSSIKFNWADDLFVWDTLLTIGLRFRTRTTGFKRGVLYGRIFVGRAPTVVFTDSEYRAEFGNISRIQFTGNVYGLGIGKVFPTKTGKHWYVEWNISEQQIKMKEDVVMQGEVPIVVEKTVINDNSRLYSIYMTMGWILF